MHRLVVTLLTAGCALLVVHGCKSLSQKQAGYTMTKTCALAIAGVENVSATHMSRTWSMDMENCTASSTIENHSPPKEIGDADPE